MAAKQKLFTKTMVEQTIKYFADPKSADETDTESMKALISDYIRFEEVVREGRIEHDAMPLAEDFLIYAKDWMKKNKLEKVYAAAKK